MIVGQNQMKYLSLCLVSYCQVGTGFMQYYKKKTIFET